MARMMIRRGFLMALTLGLLGACADGPETTSGAVVTDVATRWSLLTVDGRTLPTRQQVTFEAPAEVLAARLVVGADGTWVYRYDHREPDGPDGAVASAGSAGTYEPMNSDPNTLRMVDGESQETFFAAFKQGVLEVSMRGQVLRFARSP